MPEPITVMASYETVNMILARLGYTKSKTNLNRFVYTQAATGLSFEGHIGELIEWLVETRQVLMDDTRTPEMDAVEALTRSFARKVVRHA